MQSAVQMDDAVAELARLDVVDIGLDGQVLPNWLFFDETILVCTRHKWSFRDAAWSVIASRAHRAGRRHEVDVDTLVAALTDFLPRGMRA